jgi:hypothetical protein
MDVIDRLDAKDISVVVLDVKDFKQEGIVTQNEVLMHKLIHLARLGKAACEATDKLKVCHGQYKSSVCYFTMCAHDDFCKLRGGVKSE